MWFTADFLSRRENKKLINQMGPEISSYRIPLDDLEGLVTSSRDDLMTLNGANLMLTGCTSFFGKWLIEALLYANQRLGLHLNLMVLSRDPSRFLHNMPHLKAHSGLMMIEGDILTADLERKPFSHAVHGANLPFDGVQSWPIRHMEAAVWGTKRLLEAAVKNKCRGLVYLSSGAAYRAEASAGSAQPSLAMKEKQTNADDNLTEASVYSVTKRFTEVYMTSLAQAHNLRVPLARCFTFAGPYMPLAGPQALGNFMADGLAGRDIVIKGDGTAVRSYMYGADLVVWLLALLARGRSGVPYNVGSNGPVSIKEAATAVHRAFKNQKIKLRILGQAVDGNAPFDYVPNTCRCENELGLSLSVNLDAICSKTAAWLAKYSL